MSYCLTSDLVSMDSSFSSDQKQQVTQIHGKRGNLLNQPHAGKRRDEAKLSKQLEKNSHRTSWIFLNIMPKNSAFYCRRLTLCLRQLRFFFCFGWYFLSAVLVLGWYVWILSATNKETTTVIWETINIYDTATVRRPQLHIMNWGFNRIIHKVWESTFPINQESYKLLDNLVKTYCCHRIGTVVNVHWAVMQCYIEKVINDTEGKQISNNKIFEIKFLPISWLWLTAKHKHMPYNHISWGRQTRPSSLLLIMTEIESMG
jgi:hypothetical protein